MKDEYLLAVIIVPMALVLAFCAGYAFRTIKMWSEKDYRGAEDED